MGLVSCVSLDFPDGMPRMQGSGHSLTRPLFMAVFAASNLEE